MGLTDWMGTFGKAQAQDLSNDLERAYEAALLIQSLELEYYNDRPVRPELELSIPRSTKAQMLRRFRAALVVCRQALDELEPKRAEFDGQELRQLQLIEAVTARYLSRSPLPSLSRSPRCCPEVCSGCSIGSGVSWILRQRRRWWPVSGVGATPPWSRCGSCCC